jgi:TPR repeat protein
MTIKALAVTFVALGIATAGLARSGNTDLRTLQVAAEAGQPEAMYQLGMRYENGRDLPKNDAQAAVWYRKASDSGHGSAMFSLGGLYAAGRGVPKDLPEAYKWFDLSSKHGFKDEKLRAAGARDALARAMSSGMINDANRREADWHTAFELRQK